MLGLGALVDAAAPRARRRFNLLLLEEREYYFADYAATRHRTPDDQDGRGGGGGGGFGGFGGGGGYGGVHAASSVPLDSRPKQKGRLHVCSKSLVFDPDDSDEPLLRVPLRDVSSITFRRAPIADGVTRGEAEYIALHTRSVVEIAHNAPYIFHKLDLSSPQSEVILSLAYVDTVGVLAFVQQLHGLYRLPPSEKPAALAALIRSREESVPFESSALVDLRERALLPGGAAILAQQVLPLLQCPGRLQLTDQRLYFQHFHPLSADATIKVDLADVRRMYKRRHAMRDSGLELFIPNRSASSSFSSSSSSAASSASSFSPLSQTSVYFTFPTKSERDLVHDLILSCPRYAPQSESSLSAQTSRWLRGESSSFEYLLFLNQLAGRSWMDLTQYPVMPWILRDYESDEIDLTNPDVYRDLSKPIGALNPARLESLQRRMREMPPEIAHGHPFLYGTHYSSPGYVLFYLVRKAPQYVLRLQSGRFDQPDRSFHSIQSIWSSVLSSPTDVKELIPEFYAWRECGDAAAEFLVNNLDLELGVRQNGTPVDDVTLPPWAHGSPARFLKVMRDALESEHVSAHLHEWIDLIFGYKQKGDAAREANNVFHPLTYEGAVDLDSVTDPTLRRSFEMQINEFGQTPRQLFTRPHPRRGDTNWQPQEEEDAAAASGAGRPTVNTDDAVLTEEEALSIAGPAQLSRVLSEQAPFSPQAAGSSGAAGIAIPPRGSPPLVNGVGSMYASTPSPAFSSARISAADLSRADFSLLDREADALTLAAEVANVQTRDLSELGVQLATSPPVSTSFSPPPSTIIGGASISPSDPGSDRALSAGSSSSSTRCGAWSHLTSVGWRRLDPLSLHRDSITSVQLSGDDARGLELVSVSADGHIKIFSLASSRLIRSSRASDMALSCCALGGDASARLVYASGWDNHVHVYNQSHASVVASVQAHDDAVSALDAAQGKLVSGSWDTVVKLWSLREDGSLESQHASELAEHDAPITALALDPLSARSAVSGSEDGAVVLWDLRAPDAAGGRHIEGFDCAVTSLAYATQSGLLAAAAADGSLRFIDAGSGRPVHQLHLGSDCGDTLRCIRTDGFSLVGVGDAGVVRGWNLRSAEEIMHIDSHAGAQVALALSNDGSRICVANQKAHIFQYEGDQ